MNKTIWKTVLITSVFTVPLMIYGLTQVSHQSEETTLNPGNVKTCLRACRKEYGNHITKAIPVDGRGCYCYP